MAAVQVDQQAVNVTLSRWERPFAGGRTRIVVPRSAVRASERVDQPTRRAATPGGRAGLLITGVLKLGRWGVGTRTSRFVSVRRWVPALRLTVDDATAEQLGYDELLISTHDVDRITATLGPPR
jgi:hypothetical protein